MQGKDPRLELVFAGEYLKAFNSALDLIFKLKTINFPPPDEPLELEKFNQAMKGKQAIIDELLELVGRQFDKAIQIETAREFFDMVSGMDIEGQDSGSNA